MRLPVGTAVGAIAAGLDAALWMHKTSLYYRNRPEVDATTLRLVGLGRA